MGTPRNTTHTPSYAYVRQLSHRKRLPRVEHHIRYFMACPFLNSVSIFQKKIPLIKSQQTIQYNSPIIQLRAINFFANHNVFAGDVTLFFPGNSPTVPPSLGGHDLPPGLPHGSHHGIPISLSSIRHLTSHAFFSCISKQ